MSEARRRSDYIEVDEESNALDYLAKACNFIEASEGDPVAWKWVVIGLHGALYGFAVCALKGTDANSVVTHTKKGDRLISFGEALKRCQDPEEMCMTVMARALELSAPQRTSIDLLRNLLRNNFEHFVPRGWSIEIHGMPQIAMDVLDAIQFLALDSGTYVSLDDEQQEMIRSYVGQAKQMLQDSKLYQEAAARAQHQ